MNERINELLLEAHKQTKGGIYSGHLSDWTEKFAELIVKECVEVCRRGKYGRKDDLDTIQFDSGIRFCMNAIDDHFGD